MQNLQKQLRGIALLLFGLLVTIIGAALEHDGILFFGGILGFFGLCITFWSREGV